MDSENKLVERIVRALGKGARLSRKGRIQGRLFDSGVVRLGTGDDAAVVALSRRTTWVLSCDSFIEGVHFLAESYPGDSVGYKSLARATSDLAAMGARPRYFLMALVLPRSRTGKWLDEFLGGMRRAARELGIRLIGGDTTQDAKVSIDITVIGEIESGKEVTRSGAKPGDTLYVSGKLGKAELGLQLIRNGLGENRKYKEMLQPHLYPRIRLELGEWLARNRVASAMMDLSDGLSTDLNRLCAASKVGAQICHDRLPMLTLDYLKNKLPAGLQIDPLQLALHGGEDYELLFAVPKRSLKRLGGAPGFGGLAAIGNITSNRQIVTVGPDGSAHRLEPLGWDPFRTQ